jgi:microcin C transport system permease protein
LDFLGFGLEIPTPSWGELLSQAQKNFTVAWWLALYPSLALFSTLTLLNLIGEGIRDAMDPKVL